MMDTTNPFEIVKNINKKSGRHIFSDDEKPAFYVINRAFSNTPDSVMFSNEVNKFSIDDNQMIYDFYYFGLPMKNRFGKYNKKQSIDDKEFIDAIMELYDYSLDKALQVAVILQDKKEEILKLVYKGGKCGT